jgi:hypothetical protein
MTLYLGGVGHARTSRPHQGRARQAITRDQRDQPALPRSITDYSHRANQIAPIGFGDAGTGEVAVDGQIHPPVNDVATVGPVPDTSLFSQSTDYDEVAGDKTVKAVTSSATSTLSLPTLVRSKLTPIPFS